MARREFSRKELAQRLRRAGHRRDETERLLAELTERNLLSDRRFAEALIVRRSDQGYGPLRIEAELAARGVDRSTVEEALAECGEHWSERLQQVYARRFGSIACHGGRERAHRYRFLAQRGFSAAAIRALLGDDPEAT